MKRNNLPTSPAALLAAGWSALVLGWRASARCSIGRLALTLVIAASAPVAAWYGKLLVDELALGRSGQAAHVVFYAVAAAIAAAVGLLGQQLTTYLLGRHNAAITLRTESDLFEKVCGFVGLRYLEDPGFQDNLMVAESAASHGPSSINDFAEGSTRAVISILSFLGIVAVVCGPHLRSCCWLQRFLVWWRRSCWPTAKWWPAWRSRRCNGGDFFYRMLLTSEQAAKEVRLFGLGDHFRGLQLDALRRSQEVTLGLAGRTTVVQSGLSLLGAVISGVAVAIVALRVVRGELTPGDVLLFMAAVGSVQAALSDLVGRIGSVVESLKSFQRYLEVMALPAVSQRRAGRSRPEHLRTVRRRLVPLPSGRSVDPARRQLRDRRRQFPCDRRRQRCWQKYAYQTAVPVLRTRTGPNPVGRHRSAADLTRIAATAARRHVSGLHVVRPAGPRQHRSG